MMDGPSSAMFGAVLAASLLGSAHCAGMCGAFVAMAVAPGGERSAWSSLGVLNAAYSLGRLVTYASMGVAAGAVGRAVDLGASAAGVPRMAAVLAGAVMVLFGVSSLLRQGGVRVPRLPAPPGARAALVRGHRAVMGWAPPARALAIGLMTTLLPCGWLYAFVATAAGTGDPLSGAVVMAAFWLGTLPVLAALGLGVRGLLGPLGRRAPALTAGLLVGVGLWTLAGRAALPGAVVVDGVSGEARPACCGR